MKTRKIKFSLFVLLTIIMIFVAISYGRVEFLTSRYGDVFVSLYHQIGIFNEIDYFKIMDYTDTETQVYYVLKDKSAGILARFLKDNVSWSLADWKTVWSSSGSANGLIWPYYH